MAGTSVKRRLVGIPGSAMREAIIQVNKLIVDVEVLRAAIAAVATKLDTDGGVSATDFLSAAGAVSAAGGMTAAKIVNDEASAYTA